jgi:type IV pilus assembly protein PilB
VLSGLPDHDSAQDAVRAAMGGSLVLSALHTSDDSTSGIRRLLDLDIPPYLISDAIVGILSQRLVHKICPKCKKQTEPSAATRKAIERFEEPIDTYYRGIGCPECRHTGFAGRIALHELLIPDSQMRHLIHDGIKEAGLRSHALKKGMIPLASDGIEKVRAGIISLEEVLRVVTLDR